MKKVEILCIAYDEKVWTHPPNLVNNQKTQNGPYRIQILYACMLGFCRTLEIIARTLREVVNLGKLKMSGFARFGPIPRELTFVVDRDSRLL